MPQYGCAFSISAAARHTSSQLTTHNSQLTTHNSSLFDIKRVDHRSLPGRVLVEDAVDAHAQEGCQLDEFQRREGERDEIEFEIDRFVFGKRVLLAYGDIATGVQSCFGPDHFVKIESLLAAAHRC